MLPFIIDEGELPFHNLDYIFLPGIKKEIEDAKTEFEAYVKWTQIIGGMAIYTDTALKAYLEQAGFCKIQSHKNKKGWLCITAQKR